MLATSVHSAIQNLHRWLLSRQGHRSVLAAACALAAVVVVWLIARSRRPSAEEMERRRRERLAATGRITDGSLLDTRTLGNEESHSRTPEVLVYRYRLAGVVYECAQDVSRLPEQVRRVHVGHAVQVRYDPRNPGDSIVLAEGWSGLWLPGRLAGEPLHDAHRSPCAQQK